MNPWKEISLSVYENRMSLDFHKQPQAMNEIGYRPLKTDEYPLPNGKKLIMIDFEC